MAPALLHIFLHCHFVFNSSRLRRAALTRELLVGYYWETAMNAMSAAAYQNIIIIIPSALSAFVVHCFI